MEKIVAVPTIKTGKHSLRKTGLRMFDKVAEVFWSLRCRRHNYHTLLLKTIDVVEDILERHSLIDRFYAYRNFELSVETKIGWSLNLSKAYSSIEENIILILYKDMPHGQTTFSITFNNENGKIIGIQNMYQGFCVDSYFQDEESDVLNPDVLANIMVSRRHLATGKITEMKISNKPISFGPLRFTEGDFESTVF